MSAGPAISLLPISPAAVAASADSHSHADSETAGRVIKPVIMHHQKYAYIHGYFVASFP